MKRIEGLPVLALPRGPYSAAIWAELDEALASGDIAQSERGIEILSHSLGQSVLRDARFRADHLRTVDKVGISDGAVLDFKKRMLLGQGLNKERQAIRRLFTSRFGTAQLPGVRQAVAEIAEELVGALSAAGPLADVFGSLCAAMPSRLYCRWVGAPPQDAPFAARISEQVLRIFQEDPRDAETIVAGYTELFAYIDAKFAAPQQLVAGGMMPDMIADIERGEISALEARDFIAMLLEAATDNTSHQIAIVLIEALSRPDLWRRMVADPDLVPAFRREASRLCSRTGAIPRYAAEDVELDGRLLPKGSAIFVNVWAAHRDPRVFEDPGRFSLDRPAMARTLAFGGGHFSCLGRPIAEIEIDQILVQVLRRYPNLRLEQADIELSPYTMSVNRLHLGATP